MNISRTEVSAELGLGLVSPENIIVPLMAALSYTSTDPYAVRMAFDVGTDEAVEWTLARDLLAAALHAREGIGDVQAWPSTTSCDPDAGIVPAAGGNPGVGSVRRGIVWEASRTQVSSRLREVSRVREVSRPGSGPTGMGS